MNTRFAVDDLTGSWTGEYRLWLGPDVPVRESATHATVTGAANDKFIVITYAWTDAEKPHDGVLLVRLAEKPSPVDMVWIDSFHTMGGFMHFVGHETTDGSVEGTTTWSAGEGPDWGWRIIVSHPTTDELLVRMYIATPTGEESPAVESRYRRS
jgi:hypothetical protein